MSSDVYEQPLNPALIPGQVRGLTADCCRTTRRHDGINLPPIQRLFTQTTRAKPRSSSDRIFGYFPLYSLGGRQSGRGRGGGWGWGEGGKGYRGRQGRWWRVDWVVSEGRSILGWPWLKGSRPLCTYMRTDYADVCKLGHEYACARGVYASRLHLITVAKARLSYKLSFQHKCSSATWWQWWFPFFYWYLFLLYFARRSNQKLSFQLPVILDTFKY